MGAKDLKVGVVGYGGIGKFHLQGWLALRGEGVAVTAVCDADPAKWAVVEDVYTGAGLPVPDKKDCLYTSVDEFVAKSGVDVVSICLPNFLHEPVAVKCFDAGMHVLLEKPAANTLDGAQNIVAAWRRSGKVGAAQLNNNYTPTYELAESLVKDGAFGELQTVDGWWTRRNGIPFYGEWFGIKAKSGGGPGIDLMPHLLGWMLGLQNWPQAIWISARTYDRAEPGAPGYGPYGGGRKNPDGVYDVERRIQVYSQLENGVTMNVSAAWAMHTDLERMGFRLIGSKGTLHVERVWPTNDGDDAKAIDTATFYTTKDRGGRPWTVNRAYNPDTDPSTRDAFMGRTKTQPDMLRCIRGGGKPKTTVEHLLAIQVIIDAAYTSATRTGEPVRV
ncbi:MAG TPA: Gfo/Idh/MocA family oxidoreductase [Chthonomonadales bacterium]|nr:Gfo/Idh/MocA family oxidoreductase [Chthonomonadales bacterium]